jgi:hypothetical protein
MMYLPLTHEFMKLTKVLSRVVLFTLSKSGQIIAPFIHRGDNIRKTRNSRKIKQSKPSSQDFLHIEPVESPIDPRIMESPGERCAASNMPSPCSPSKARFLTLSLPQEASQAEKAAAETFSRKIL